jgi:multidrug efflux pump subunit AcrA (membrane-fusion protein)
VAYVFLSHSHSDKEFARKLAADLRANGHSVWIDEAEINIGDSLIEKIREGLDAVDYVCAILSKSSIDSLWVQKELDIASNREIDEKRVVVLPLVITDVELPGFLKGKFYGDFRDQSRYQEVLQMLLRALGGGKKASKANEGEVEALRSALKYAQAQAEAHQRAAERAEHVAFRSKSDQLKQAIANANAKFPDHAPINNTYAFQAGSMPVTLDYLLWAIAKASHRGYHPLDALITIDNKWDDVESMLEAYNDMVDSSEDDASSEDDEELD